MEQDNFNGISHHGSDHPAHQIRAKVGQAAQNALQQLECGQHELSRRYHIFEDANYELAVRRPGCTLAAVAVVGFVIGCLLSQGRR